MGNVKAVTATEQYVNDVRDAFLSEDGKECVKASRELLKYTNERLDELTESKLKDKDEQINLLKRRFTAAEKFATDEQVSQETKLSFYNEMKSINIEIDGLFAEKKKIIETRDDELEHDKRVAEFGAYVAPVITSSLKFAMAVVQAILTANAGKKA